MRHEPGYIIVDTEGTGLFLHRNKETGEVVPSDAPGQPRMASFAAVLVDADFNVDTTYHAYVKPYGWKHADGTDITEMPAEAFNVHGLSYDFLMENGLPARDVLEIYRLSIAKGRAVLGFNQQHDGRQIRAELRHAGLDDMFEQTKTTCVMRSLQGAGIKIKKLNGKGGYPRLIDACAHFSIPYDETAKHDALRDAIATNLLATAIREHLIEPAVHYASGYKGEKDQ
jgi:DNA polymerase III epsilon subunit-like protein